MELLERQVDALQNMLHARNKQAQSGRAKADRQPGRGRGAEQSVVELVAAAGPSVEEVKHVEYLEGRVEQLERQCAEVEGGTQRRYTSPTEKPLNCRGGVPSSNAPPTASLPY